MLNITGGADSTTFPSNAGAIDVTQPPYNADNTGQSDVTDVIQRAIDDSQGLFRCRTLYFPNGTYNVNDTLAIYKAEGSGKAQGRHCMTWQGESEDGVIIELADNAGGFDDPDAPKPVISTLECSGCGTNTNFGISLAKFTVNVGTGNSGATGLLYMVNNTGAVRDVTVRASNGVGFAGFDLRQRNIPGPVLIQRVTVDSFDYGLDVDDISYSQVYENITLMN